MSKFKNNVLSYIQEYSIHGYNNDFKDSKSLKSSEEDTSLVRGFSINEESSPESGKKYGSYGYIDKTGDLHYIEYTRNKDGSL